jgi:arylsulfatase A-like enzyme
VLILIDDLGRNDLGCYGSTYYRTPHIDALANEGMRFTHAYAACCVCSPTRASILTGKHPARLHLTDWLPGRPDRSDQMLLRPDIRQELPLEEVTLAERLRERGYATAHIGKWHLGGAGFEPTRQGFDVSIGGDHSGSPLSYFAPFREAKGRFMPGLADAADGEYLTDRLTTEAIEFISENDDRPFFLYLPHYAVHTPLRAKEEIIAKYSPGEIGKQNNPVYAAMIESVDESVGRILEALEEKNLIESTIVIFTSDNGGLSVIEGPKTPSTINQPLREGKGYLYEGGIRVPLIVKWPGIVRAGSETNVAVSSVDLFFTILQMCGDSDSESVDGQSYLSVLKSQAVDKRQPLFWHYPHYSNQGGRPASAIRDQNYKLIEFLDDGRRELFDLGSDEGEHRNLILEKPDVAKQLAEQLSAWREAIGAQTMRPNPNYVPNPQDDDGNVHLMAKTARVFGTQLRYEPLPHKNTLGYWIEVDDYATWEFTVSKAGEFKVNVLQGCGKGQGGSQVELRVADQTLEFTVEDTGHFQNFVEREVGSIRIKEPGRYTLVVKPLQKAAQAVMDLRAVSIVRKK